MSKKNTTRRPGRNANARNLNRREEALHERRREGAHRRHMEAFSLVAPVAERLAQLHAAFASSTAGQESAVRLDRLVRDAAGSALGQRALTALVSYMERGLNAEACEGEARSAKAIRDLEASEPVPAPEPEPVVEPAPVAEPAPYGVEDLPVMSANLKGDLADRLAASRAEQAAAREAVKSKILELEAEATRLRRTLG